MKSKSLVFVLFLLIIPGVLFSGTTGKIKGTVKDKTTGAPLVRVNVVIEGTTLGAATNEKGEFYIINIPPGTYTVQFSIIGYRVLKAEDVRVIADYTTPLSVEMSEQALTTGEVIVTAEKEIIKRDLTATASFHSKEEIINMPVNSFTEVMNTAAGFITSKSGADQGIHLRGGRTGEVAYYVDGFYIEDPLYGGAAADVSRLGIQDLSILTGTFNAEYGQAMSGIVNIITPEGGPTYSGQIRMGTDQLVEHFDWGSSRMEGALSGPVPGFGKKLTFFITGDHSESDTYLNKFQWGEYTFNANTFDFSTRITDRLVFRPTDNAKFSFGSNHSRHKFKEFAYAYLAYPEGYGTDHNNSDMYNFTWTQTLSRSTFFEAKAARFQQTNYYALTDDWDPNNVSDLALIRPRYRIYFTDEFIEDYPQYAAWAGSNYEFWGPWIGEHDELVQPVTSFYQKYKNTETSFMFDITSQVHPEHLMKMGMEYRSFTIQNHWIGGINTYAAWDTLGNYLSEPDDPIHDEIADYEFKPKQAAFYVQDKMEFENLIVNLGLRLDYLDVAAKGLADKYALRDPANAVYKDVKAKYKISPRLGFGYPITDQAVLHFAYGRFIQFPDFQYLYRRWNKNLPYPNLNQGYEPSLGNPALKPEQTITYELGAEWMVSDNVGLDVTVYYKDIYDFISTQRIDISPSAYTAIINLDYGNSRGIEVSLNKRFSNHYTLRANYVYSRTEGNADDWETHADEMYTASVTGLVPPKSTNTLPWDQPHTLSFVLDIRYPDNWGVNFIGNLGSGMPYTPIDARGKYLGKKNSGRKPWTGTVDMRISKDLHFTGLKYRLWADVRNLMNKTNIYNVFGNSGKENFSTNPNASPLWQFRPHWYAPPRHVELGISVIF